jgi:hypothetical protein
MPEIGRGSRHGVTMIGVLVGIVDVEIWRHFVPSVADIRTAEPFNSDIEAAERTALIAGTLFTLVVAGFTRSLEVFAIGGLALVALDYSVKHANAVHPATGKMAAPMPTASGLSESYPMPDYANVG